MKTNGCDQAFPQPKLPTQSVNGLHTGLTKREYFAAIALQALGGYLFDAGLNKSEIAKEAVKFSDALIEALNTRD